jgi:DNA-binding NarL/FixJ family response regulator
MKLSRRQKQVLIGLASSKTIKEIAFEWGRSNKTVECAKAELYRKLGLFDIAALTRYAISRRLIKVE